MVKVVVSIGSASCGNRQCHEKDSQIFLIHTDFAISFSPDTSTGTDHGNWNSFESKLLALQNHNT